MKKIYFFLFPILFSLNTAFSQPSFPPPTGVFCSCGPTTGLGNGSVSPLVAAKPFVKGILVRVTWDIMEPADNQYNWSLIDGQIAAANTYGKKISLGVGCGIHIPQWVFNAGAQRLVSSVPFTDTLAVPWDTVFLNRWTDFITALGNRYQNDTTIQLVYMTASTGNGFEMQLPFVTTPTIAAVGYTDTKMINSWKTIVDAFNNAFPNHYLSNDFHPVNGSNVVADSVYAYAVAAIGDRYGANAWWWTQHNTTVYPAQYAILQNSASNNVFTGIQMARNGTNDSTAFGPGGMPAALQLAIDGGVCYWEVWNQDILNPDFETLLSEASCEMVTSAPVPSTIQKNIKVYPNPVSSSLTIELPQHCDLEIVDMTGGRIFAQKNVSDRVQIDYTGFASGVYFVKVMDGNGSVFNQKFIRSE